MILQLGLFDVLLKSGSLRNRVDLRPNKQSKTVQRRSPSATDKEQSHHTGTLVLNQKLTSSESYGHLWSFMVIYGHLMSFDVI